MGLIVIILFLIAAVVAIVMLSKSAKKDSKDTECLETKIAGINYRKGISKYVGPFKGNIVPEPDNEYDKNALKVVNLDDGKHFGYVPTEDIAEVAALIAGDYPYPCVGTIKKHYDEDEGRTFYSAELFIPYPNQKYIADIKRLHPDIYPQHPQTPE